MIRKPVCRIRRFPEGPYFSSYPAAACSLSSCFFGARIHGMDDSVRIVFSDADGTLLDSSGRMLPDTLYSIRALEKRNIPFVIVSARSPAGIRTIQEANGFSSPLIAFSGALIMDEKRKILYSDGMAKETAAAVIRYAEENCHGCVWNLYTADRWITEDASDPRVIKEESIVGTHAEEGSPDMLPDDASVGKVLLMCRHEQILDTERMIRSEFPSLSVTRSSSSLIEIMHGGVSKRSAAEFLCRRYGIPMESAAAFGDNHNDREMLEAVGMPFLMGNAPDELRREFSCCLTDSNDENGIYNALVDIGTIRPR